MPTTHPQPGPPQVAVDSVTWRLPRELAPGGIRLEVDWTVPGDTEFVADGEWWTYRLERPRANRFEYRLELRGGGGLGPDPGNPDVIEDPFGARSEIRFPDYRPPDWLAGADTGSIRAVDFEPNHLDVPVPARLWSPAGLADDEPAPLLVAHDGTALAERGSLLVWASRYADRRPLRVALLDPAFGSRDGWYGGNPVYLAEVAQTVLPAIGAQVAVSTKVGLGISLGAFAMFYLHRLHPGLLDGVVLQSGSFFTRDFDPQESGYVAFDRVCAAVRGMTDPPNVPLPVLITCGAIEENLSNNQSMAERLSAAGYPLKAVTVPDAHTMIGWRDAWSPHLAELLDLVD